SATRRRPFALGTAVSPEAFLVAFTPEALAWARKLGDFLADASAWPTLGADGDRDDPRGGARHAPPPALRRAAQAPRVGRRSPGDGPRGRAARGGPRRPRRREH